MTRLPPIDNGKGTQYTNTQRQHASRSVEAKTDDPLIRATPTSDGTNTKPRNGKEKYLILG